MLDKGKEFIITGHSICHGIAIGHPFFLNREHFTVCEKTLASTLMPREVERYRLALVHCRQDIKRLQKQLEMESASEGIIILEAQLEMLQDPLLTSEIEAAIYKNKKNVEFIFQQSIDKLQIRFSTLKDSFFLIALRIYKIYLEEFLVICMKVAMPVLAKCLFILLFAHKKLPPLILLVLIYVM